MTMTIFNECDSCENLNIFINGTIYGDIINENNISFTRGPF